MNLLEVFNNMQLFYSVMLKHLRRFFDSSSVWLPWHLHRWWNHSSDDKGKSEDGN